MGKRRGVIFIGLGGALALLVGIAVYAVTQNATTTKIVTKNVVVALQDIPGRTVVLAGAVGVKAMPADAIPAGAFTKAQEVIGKMTPDKIYAGEIILAPKLVESNGQTGLSFTLPKGKVLITFPASNIVGLGLVHPGDAVDVLVTYLPSKVNANAQGQQGAQNALSSETQTTLQDLKIVSVGSQTSQPNSPQPNQGQTQTQQNAPTSVTFAVDPQDALTLKALKDSQDLTLEVALRAAGDDQTFKTVPVTLKSALEHYGINTSTAP